MPCNYPLTRRVAPNGGATIYGEIQRAAGKIPPLQPNYKEHPIPCGRCAGCKVDYGRGWAIRLMHEAQLHQRTCWATLTYDDDHLPTPARPRLEDQRGRALAARSQEEPQTRTPPRTRETHAHDEHASLSKADLRGFTQRLNSDVRRRFGKGVKYYACGEYGDLTHRPHYHIAIFGEDFTDDRIKWKLSNGNQLWRSSRLTRLWPYGGADIGDLTHESAAYIARYILKKITGTKAHEHYKRTDENGNDYWLQPEFSVMSRGGRTGKGLASEWFRLFNRSVYPHDNVITRGHPSKPPRYYDKLLEELDKLEYEVVKMKREHAQRNPEDQTPARLDARETVLLAKLNQNKRSLE